MKIARVFPRKTKASPTDDLAFFGPPGFWPPEVDEVHISVAFTYDMKIAGDLAKEWNHVAPVKIGGPALGEPSGEFVPGRYIKPGYVITSRGCPNTCWFCSVWKREPRLIELPIPEGWNLLDDNILACSEGHIRKVFSMLKHQPHRAQFTGGLEAKLLRDWHIDLLNDLRPGRIFFAYDTDDDYEPLVEAARMVFAAGFLSPASNNVRCYCLIGYKGDTFAAAEKRMRQVLELGMFPMAMVWRNKKGERSPEWISFAWLWSRPACINAMKREAKLANCGCAGCDEKTRGDDYERATNHIFSPDGAGDPGRA